MSILAGWLRIDQRTGEIANRTFTNDLAALPSVPSLSRLILLITISALESCPKLSIDTVHQQ